MRTTIRNAVLGLAVAATAFSVVPAQANGHWHGRNSNNDALVAGIAGLAVGAIVGGLASQPNVQGRVYIDPPYRPVYRTAPSYHYAQPVYQAPRYNYRAAFEPWTQSWYRACNARYRSFDPSSGTFLGYDGQRHFCNLN